jgi:hypothetical protein
VRPLELIASEALRFVLYVDTALRRGNVWQALRGLDELRWRLLELFAASRGLARPAHAVDAHASPDLQRKLSGAVADADLRALRAGTGENLSVRGLPAGRGHVYELWCVADRRRWISGGTFRVDAHGRARISLTSAARPGEYELMLVTRRSDGERGRRVLAGNVDY